MKIISLFKSCFDCFFGFFLSKFKPLNQECYLVGSNYGDRPDPNALQIIKELECQGRLVFVVANTSNGISTLQRGSLKAAYYFFCSKTCFYTHSLSDVIPHAHKLSSFRNIFRFPKLIFLQHGVIGLKSVMSNSVMLRDYIKSLEPTFDYMITSSINELGLIEQFGVPRQKIAVTGLPRFDRYHESQIPKKTVLIFFTWQSEDNIKSKFDQIKTSGVLETFHQNGYTVVSASHDMQKEVDKKSNLSNEELQNTIESCSLLITDDSSMAWDVLYRKQEVIFLSPSQKWLINDSFLLARRCFTADDLSGKVDAYFKNTGLYHDFIFADYYDCKNTQRVLALV